MDTNHHERERSAAARLLKVLCDERIINGEAAVALCLTVRQAQRLKRRYRERGAAGLSFRRGESKHRRSNRSILCHTSWFQ